VDKIRISENLMDLLGAVLDPPAACHGCGKPIDDSERDYCMACTLSGKAGN